MDAFVKQLKKNPIISKNIVTYNKKISNSGWKYQTNNCVECTFVLENNCCKMCFSKQTHKWNYVNDVDGDTTYQTEYTNEIVNNASEIIKIGINDLLNRNLNLVFCLTRPPGHHSCENRRSGFCHKNFAIEALDIFNEKGKNVLILDIDAHHGDGSEQEIVKRKYGYYISIHGFGKNVYPGTGASNNEYCLNLPLSSSSKDEEWFNAFSIAEHKIKEIQPDVIVLSCGFDGYYKDLIAPLQLSEKFYEKFGEKLANLQIPILSILEGGYYVDDLGKLCEDFINQFTI